MKIKQQPIHQHRYYSMSSSGSNTARQTLTLTLATILVLVSCLIFNTAHAAGSKDYYDENDVFVHDLKLYVKGEEFFVKGIVYNPTPLGITKMGTGGQGGGGFCSVRRNYFGNSQSACYYEDYYDGMKNTATGFPTTTGPWFKPLWDRDFPIIKEMGVNTIRVYHMQPFTKTLFQKFPNLFGPPQYTQPGQGAEHLPFLDACQEHGFKAIIPIVAEEENLVLRTDEELNAFVEARVDELGNHPALLMWCVGNNLGLYNKPDLKKKVNQMITKVKSYMLQKWNRIVPVTNAESDLPTAYISLLEDMKVDLFTANVYRGLYLSKLWRPDANAPTKEFPGWKTLSKNYGIPILLGEFGAHHQLAENEQQADWVNHQVKAIYDAREDGCIGGVFKEYSDEFNMPDGDNDMGVVKFTPTAQGNKDSTQPAVFVPDTVEKKDVIFDALAMGVAGSSVEKYNFNTTVFEVSGTTPSVVDPTAIPVKSGKPPAAASSGGNVKPPPARGSNNVPIPGVSRSSPRSRDSDSAGSSARSTTAFMAVVCIVIVALAIRAITF